MQGMNGMDSLADELGDVWGEDAADEQGSSFLEGLREGSTEPGPLHQGNDKSIEPGGMHDFGMGIPALGSQPPSPILRHSSSLFKSNTLSSQLNGRQTSPARHHRIESSYDGSDYGPDSDPESALSPTLLRRISDIESLIRISAHADDLSENGGIVTRTIIGLKDLGPQASIENGTTRLITACTSMATHRVHKTKELLSQSHGLLFAPQAYGNGVQAQMLGEEVLDELLGSVEDLIESIPVTLPGSGPNALLSLQILVSNTAELVYALRSLADVLAESKVVAAAAGRRLKGVKELVAEIRSEEELREEGVRWIESGDWERRLNSREGAKICGEVVSGFERVCEKWRERLVGGMSAGGEGGAGGGRDVEVGA